MDDHRPEHPMLMDLNEFRIPNDDEQMIRWARTPQPDPRGGETICLLKHPEGDVLAKGHAICSPEDNYNKRIGRAKALGRAISAYSRGESYGGPAAHRKRGSR